MQYAHEAPRVERPELSHASRDQLSLRRRPVHNHPVDRRGRGAMKVDGTALRRRGRLRGRYVVVACIVGSGSAVVSCSSKSAGPTYYARETLLDPTTCKQCHADHYADWSASMHSY